MAFEYTRAPMRRARSFVWLVILLTLSACASGPKKPPVGTLEPDKFLWERGTEELNKKHWLVSREYFRQLMDSYPQSQYRADAKLGLADSYLGEGSSESNVLAVNEYREFLSFYPTHKRAYYAQFKLGMCHYYQMHGPDRDQTETKEAITELTAFVQRYSRPEENPLLDEGRARLREAKDRMSDADYRVAIFYLKTQKFPPAAIDRFKAILKDDPEYSRRDGVYFNLAEALIRMKQEKEALVYLDRLTVEFEQSEFLEQTKKLIDTLKADPAAKKPKNGSVSHES